MTEKAPVLDDPANYLWTVDIGRVIKEEFIKADLKRVLFGFLPKMATHSRCSVGSLQASGYAERVKQLRQPDLHQRQHAPLDRRDHDGRRLAHE